MRATVLAVGFALSLTGSALCAPITFTTILSGANESPANASPGHGSATVTYDPATHLMRVEVSFGDLIGNTTASHIHCCTAVPGAGNAGVATQTPTFTGFPLGVTSGTYDHTFDMSLLASYNLAFVTAHGGSLSDSEAALAAGLESGQSYLNVHSSSFPSGEIRGFLTDSGPVPEPAGLALLGSAIGTAVGLWRRRVA